MQLNPAIYQKRSIFSAFVKKIEKKFSSVFCLIEMKHLLQI